MERIYGPVVAGTFYPAQRDLLEAQIRGLLSAAQPPQVGGRLVGLIVPHAGLIYSGPVAAVAYALLQGSRFERVLAIGPSHHVSFEGLATLPTEGWRTPLGVVPVAEPDGTDLVHAMPGPFDQEHCLEVQLPFLQMTLASPTVTPLLFGVVGHEEAADALAGALGPDDLLLVSSDLSHYLSQQEAETLDQATARSIVARNPAGLGRNSACGRVPIQTALALAKRAGWRVELLKLATSADTAGDPGRVVGYGAFAFVTP